MRKFISILENSEIDNEIIHALKMPDVELATIVIPAGTPLYHGTDRPSKSWNPKTTPIFTPAWFGLNLQVARNYSTWNRSSENGKPYVIEYRTTVSLNLLDISSEQMEQQFDVFYGDYMAEDIATSVISMGYDGWYLINNEVMIGDADSVNYVKCVPIDR